MGWEMWRPDCRHDVNCKSPYFARADEVVRWLREGNTMAQAAWKRAIREWARDELRARAKL